MDGHRQNLSLTKSTPLKTLQSLKNRPQAKSVSVERKKHER
nr:MAG TPA: hypothetical protein [Caudoviricetes sp.]